MRSVFSELLRQERLIVVEDLKLDQPKTRDLVAKLKTLELDHVLMLVDEYDNNLVLAARNLPWADVLDLREINPVSLIRYDKILASAAAVKALEEQLS